MLGGIPGGTQRGELDLARCTELRELGAVTLELGGEHLVRGQGLGVRVRVRVRVKG